MDGVVGDGKKKRLTLFNDPARKAEADAARARGRANRGKGRVKRPAALDTLADLKQMRSWVAQEVTAGRMEKDVATMLLSACKDQQPLLLAEDEERKRQERMAFAERVARTGTPGGS